MSESAVRRIEIGLLQEIKLCYKELTLGILHDPKNIVNHFSEEVCRKSFSGNTYPEITKLDYYFLIKNEEEVIGFFRVIDLHFESKIELHGSYGYKNNSHIKSYFVLSKLFIWEIVKRFHKRKITTVANKENKNAIHYIKWLGFVEVKPNDDVINMIDLELDKDIYYTNKENFYM